MFPALVVATTVAVAGCGVGSGPEGPEAPRTAIEGLTRRGCQYVTDPDAMPTFAQLTRSGTRGNIALWGRDMEAGDSVEVSVRYGDDGRLDWVQAIRSTVPVDRARAVEQLLLDSVDEMAGEDWGFRVLVAAGDVAEVAPSVICEPEQTGGAGIWSNVPNTREALQVAHYLRGRRVPVRVSLDEQGRVMDVQLVRSTYNRWVDQYIIDLVRATNFDPKLHDGMGVATTFELQLRFPRR